MALYATLLLALFGCSDNASMNTQSEQVQLLGLYEGIPTYSGAGYLERNNIEYIKVQDDNYTRVRLNLIEPFKSQLQDKIDTAIKYFQYSEESGKISSTNQALCFNNIIRRESDYYGKYLTDSATSDGNRCVQLATIDQNGFETGVYGGGSNGKESYSYTLKFIKIGTINDPLPLKYISPK